MIALWIASSAFVLIFVGLPVLAYLVGKYAQVGKLSGTRSFDKHLKGEK